VAAVKFVHLKKFMKGWSSFSTTKKRVHFLGALSLAWTELVICDFPGRGGGRDGRANLAGCCRRLCPPPPHPACPTPPPTPPPHPPPRSSTTRNGPCAAPR
jgi:hypothetical protein